MSILLSNYHHEFLAGNGWKCNILIWNQLEKSFLTFLTFFPILAYISLSVIDNMVPFYMNAHIFYHNYLLSIIWLEYHVVLIYDVIDLKLDRMRTYVCWPKEVAVAWDTPRTWRYFHIFPVSFDIYSYAF